MNRLACLLVVAAGVLAAESAPGPLKAAQTPTGGVSTSIIARRLRSTGPMHLHWPIGSRT